MIFSDIEESVYSGDWDNHLLFPDIDESVYRGDWANLPELVLEQVYRSLNMGERYQASQVCRNWYYAFHLPAAWHTFEFDDHTLTRRKYNYYSGWTVSL